MIITSVGPAGISIETGRFSDEIICLALVTQLFPGPNILSTRGIDSVPNAKAAIDWAPPTLKILPIPLNFAATVTASLTTPKSLGGETTTDCLFLASEDGTPSMIAVEGSGLFPAGI